MRSSSSHQADGVDVFVLSMLGTHGDLRIETICSPVSLSCAVGEAHGHGLRGYALDISARYRQLYRHAFGQLSSAVALAELLRNLAGTAHVPMSSSGLRRLAWGSIQLHYMPALLGFFVTIHAIGAPQGTGSGTARILDACAALRLAAGALSIVATLASDGYVHAADARWRRPDASRRLGLRPMDARGPSAWLSVVELGCLPLGCLFALVGLLHVQLTQLITTRLAYTVSLKPALPPIQPRCLDDKASFAALATTPC